jgi:N-acetylglutamate synthase-like GNAT family acetyltransferase
MAIKQIDFGSPEYDQMVLLRKKILREPLGLTFSEEELAQEKNDILIAAFDEEEILGCCVLTKFNDAKIRLRQMAVRADMQLTGIGASIMTFAENLARDKGYNYMIMHSRDTALGFYEKIGYKVVSDEFTEVGISHHIMEKELGS